MISEHTILSYFASAKPRGWQLESGSLAGGWHALYYGRLQKYNVYLHVDEQKVYLQCPLLLREANPECKPWLFEYLLRANDRMAFAKFTLFEADTKDGSVDWIALIVEIPLEQFSAATFRLMTEAIATYAEEYDREVMVLALDPEIFRKLQAVP